MVMFDSRCAWISRKRMQIPHDWANAVMAHRSFNEEVILCVIPADADSARESNGELHSRELISAMLEQLSKTDCQVRDALLLSAECWWSYLCEEPECCSPAGTPLDLEIAEKGRCPVRLSPASAAFPIAMRSLRCVPLTQSGRQLTEAAFARQLGQVPKTGSGW
jgi:hypothetical protein